MKEVSGSGKLEFLSPSSQLAGVRFSWSCTLIYNGEETVVSITVCLEAVA